MIDTPASDGDAGIRTLFPGLLGRPAEPSERAVADDVTGAAATGGHVRNTLTTPELHSSTALEARLAELDAEHDTLDLAGIGTSLGSNPLTAATFGEGETDLLVITRQHGDEPGGTQGAVRSALALEAFLGTKAAATALADGSLGETNPVFALAIPDRSPDIDYDDLYGADAYGAPAEYYTMA